MSGETEQFEDMVVGGKSHDHAERDADEISSIALATGSPRFALLGIPAEIDAFVVRVFQPWTPTCRDANAIAKELTQATNDLPPGPEAIRSFLVFMTVESAPSGWHTQGRSLPAVGGVITSTTRPSALLRYSPPRFSFHAQCAP